MPASPTWYVLLVTVATVMPLIIATSCEPCAPSDRGVDVPAPKPSGEPRFPDLSVTGDARPLSPSRLHNPDSVTMSWYPANCCDTPFAVGWLNREMNPALCPGTVKLTDAD